MRPEPHARRIAICHLDLRLKGTKGTVTLRILAEIEETMGIDAFDRSIREKVQCEKAGEKASHAFKSFLISSVGTLKGRQEAIGQEQRPLSSQVISCLM